MGEPLDDAAAHRMRTQAAIYSLVADRDGRAAQYAQDVPRLLDERDRLRARLAGAREALTALLAATDPRTQLTCAACPGGRDTGHFVGCPWAAARRALAALDAVAGDGGADG